MDNKPKEKTALLIFLAILVLGMVGVYWLFKPTLTIMLIGVFAALTLAMTLYWMVMNNTSVFVFLLCLAGLIGIYWLFRPTLTVILIGLSGALVVLIIAMLLYWMAMNDIFLTIVPTNTVKMIVAKIKQGEEETERSLVKLLINSPERQWYPEIQTIHEVEKGVSDIRPWILRKFGIPLSFFLSPFQEVLEIPIVARRMARDGDQSGNWLTGEKITINAVRLDFPQRVEILDVELRDKWVVSILVQVRRRLTKPLKAFFDLRGDEMFQQFDALIKNLVIMWLSQKTYDNLISLQTKGPDHLMNEILGNEETPEGKARRKEIQRLAERKTGTKISLIIFEDMRLGSDSAELQKATQRAGVTKSNLVALKESFGGNDELWEKAVKDDPQLIMLLATNTPKEVIMAHIKKQTVTNSKLLAWVENWPSQT